MTSAESSSGINFEGSSSHQHYRSGESLAEWRSSEQVENGTPSTSLPCWDSDDDDDDDDGGQKPSDLYGRYTWKIDKFSEINKRELRSDVFDVGGYEWYILIYPQGCDVCNHLSLFLCVANHEKLKPGWSHFAQFTIAVVNKEPKKSKCSDTLHRFWKKEHDWGWKKFIELSKVREGFIEHDTLIIKAQVQVLRERADRPFRCLDILYRRELVRIYLANVVQICRLFVEDRRGKLVKLIEDRATWCSFRSFWLNMDEGSRNYMSREKAEAILKVVVKQFFIEKEVSSTLVMDSLYSGLKALKGHIKKKTGNSRYNEAEDYPYPMIRMEDDTFVLIDDLLPLLEMAAMESLPAKDEKGPQIRTKDGDAADNLNKDPTERDERRLTELGRRTIEIFVLTHIFSKIEIAYQEAVALRMQEELIQEEAALLAGSEQKGKRGAAEKEKKSKKKGKQKRNNRKVKDKEKDDKSGKNEQAIGPVEGEAVLATESEMAVEKSDVVEDISDAYDSLECVPEVVLTHLKDADAEIVQPDSSSDSFSEVVRRKPQTGNSWTNKNRKSLSRGKNQQKNVVFGLVDWYSVATRRDSQAVEPLSKTDVSLSQDTVVEKVAKPPSLARECINVEVCTNPATRVSSPPKPESKVSSGNEISGVKRSSKDSFKQSDGPPSPANSARDSFKPAPETQKLATPQPVEKSTDNRVQVASEKPPMQHLIAKTDKPSTPILSRPSSAPITSGREPIVFTVSMPQATPVLARCVRDAGHVGLEPSVSAAQGYVPQSYRNAVFGCLANQNQPTSSLDNGSLSYAHAASLASSSMMLAQSSDRIDTDPIMPSSSFEMMNRHPQNRPLWNEPIQRDNDARNLTMDRASPLTGMYSFDQHSRPLVGRSQHNPPFDFSADHRSSRQGHALAEDFPHLDIINYLLDDEHGIGRLSMSDLANTRRTFSDGLHSLDRQFSFPGEAPSGLGPSASPGGFSRTRSYHEIDRLQHGYGASGNFYQLRRRQPRNEHNGSGTYWPNQQWRHLPGSELPYQMNEDNIGYQNLNIHTVFRPSNGR